ncbi:neural cell adhesion molecule L1-like [Rhipicephalus sanguineus]|uniref:neural cell adhesion molecule L1-like n=1 Tax=Rhipicephalus sanguineus TaxID=34632 RepID=UPI0020C4A354|nr:neural cell adhesion molecule L1-like [Rhipicephalus sanguineus]
MTAAQWLPLPGRRIYNHCTRRLEVGSEETTAVVTGLVPWSQYRLILRPFFTADGDPRSLRKYGSPQHQEFSTKVGVPSVPRDLKVKETKEGVAKLNWEAPKNPAGPISGYTVTWNCNNVNNTQSTENSNILISGKYKKSAFSFLRLTAELHGCTFKVGAFNKLEDGTTFSGSDIQLSID